MRKVLLTIIVVLSVSFTGCVRTVYVPHGEPVRLRQTVRNVKVWVRDSRGQMVAGRMDLPEGWYCLPLDEETEDGNGNQSR